jgi:hypothetical protein
VTAWQPGPMCAMGSGLGKECPSRNRIRLPLVPVVEKAGDYCCTAAADAAFLIRVATADGCET